MGLVTTTGTAIRCGDRLSSLYELYLAEVNYNNDETKETIRKRYLWKAAKEVCPTALLFGATAVSILGMYNEAKTIESTLLHALSLYGGSALLYSKSEDASEDDGCPNRTEKFRVHDGYSRTEFSTTIGRIGKAEDRANAKLQNNYIVRFSSVMHSLGTDVPDYCYYLGWEMDNENQMKEWRRSGGPYISIVVDRGELYFRPEPKWLRKDK